MNGFRVTYCFGAGEADDAHPHAQVEWFESEDAAMSYIEKMDRHCGTLRSYRMERIEEVRRKKSGER